MGEAGEVAGRSRRRRPATGLLEWPCEPVGLAATVHRLSRRASVEPLLHATPRTRERPRRGRVRAGRVGRRDPLADPPSGCDGSPRPTGLRGRAARQRASSSGSRWRISTQPSSEHRGWEPRLSVTSTRTRTRCSRSSGSATRTATASSSQARPSGDRAPADSELSLSAQETTWERTSRSPALLKEKPHRGERRASDVLGEELGSNTSA